MLGGKILTNDNLRHKVFIQEIGLQGTLKLKDLQKFLDKVNLLRRFISNLSRKIDAFNPILRLKDETEFTWGAKQQETFEKIKQYLSSPPVLKTPRRGVPFRLYVGAEDKIIGVVLTQETEDNEYVITYIKPTNY